MLEARNPKILCFTSFWSCCCRRLDVLKDFLQPLVSFKTGGCHTFWKIWGRRLENCHKSRWWFFLLYQDKTFKKDQITNWFYFFINCFFYTTFSRIMRNVPEICIHVFFPLIYPVWVIDKCASIFKLLRSTGIDSKESIPPACVG